MNRRLLAALLVAACSAVSSSSAAIPSFVIQGDSTVAGLRIGRATPAAAVKSLGPATTTRAQPPYECVKTWKKLGLKLSFLDLSTGSACRTGGLVTATITNRPQWRTAVGLRVGDTVGRIRTLYPRAKFHRTGNNWTGYWLITRHACKEVGGSAFPGLLAQIHAGRVAALVAGTTACE